MIPKLRVVREFFRFLRDRQLLWLLPVLFIVLVLGVVMVAVQASPIAPFVYTLF